jgi:hypothetical protein
MNRFARTTTLPLGVDIGSELISIVSSECSANGLTIRETCTLAVPNADASRLDSTLAETLRTILKGLHVAERRCVLAAPTSDVVTRLFRVPPGMRRGEAERAAALEADGMVNWPASERLVALDPLPGRAADMLLSVARTSTIERLVRIARAAGLKPVAVDVPACAWRRALPDVDAILDCSRERAELVIFGSPIGTSHHFAPRLLDERLAAHVRSAFVEARRDGIADVQRLLVLAPRFRYESMETLLRDDGYTVAPVQLGGLEAPPWTFAFGLASWSIAPRTIVAS